MIDEIYKTVKVLANKNNYGDIPPEKFNLLATAAQVKIVDESLENLRRALNRKNNLGTSESISKLEDLLSVFSDSKIIQRESVSLPSFILPDDLVFIDSVWYKNITEVEKIDSRVGGRVSGNYLLGQSVSFPFYQKRGNKIFIFPDDIGVSGNNLTNDISIDYTRKPKAPKWTYINVAGLPTFNVLAPNYQDFELRENMKYTLIVEILSMVGIYLREEQIQNFTNTEQQQDFQNKNVN